MTILMKNTLQIKVCQTPRNSTTFPLSKFEILKYWGPQILAPAVAWLATLTFGFTSLNLSILRWGRKYERTN